MRKYIALIISLLLLFCISGCNNTAHKETKATNTDATLATLTDSQNNVIYDVAKIANLGNTSITNIEQSTFSISNDESLNITKCSGLDDESLTNNFSDCTFYIFNSNDDANKAFEYIKENLVSTIEENGNYIIGKNKNAFNIVMKEFYYKTNNMIIYRTDFIGEPDSTQEESDYISKQNINRHKEIMNIY